MVSVVEKMEEIWDWSNLNDEEQTTIEVDLEDFTKINNRGDRSLVGKIYSKSNISKEVTMHYGEDVESRKTFVFR